MLAHLKSLLVSTHTGSGRQDMPTVLFTRLLDGEEEVREEWEEERRERWTVLMRSVEITSNQNLCRERMESYVVSWMVGEEEI